MTAHCWTGAEVRCRTCKGPTVDLGDEYGSLSEGGSYERFECAEPKEAACKKPIYIELPD